MSYTTLIRLGILWGKGPGAYEKGTFGLHWGCHPGHFIDALHSSVVQKLKERPFGPFDALTLLMGSKNAHFVCQRYELSCRSSTLAVASTSTQSDSVPTHLL